MCDVSREPSSTQAASLASQHLVVVLLPAYMYVCMHEYVYVCVMCLVSLLQLKLQAAHLDVSFSPLCIHVCTYIHAQNKHINTQKQTHTHIHTQVYVPEYDLACAFALPRLFPALV